MMATFLEGYWPWWGGALALTALALLHWLGERRLLGVSGYMKELVPTPVGKPPLGQDAGCGAGIEDQDEDSSQQFRVRGAMRDQRWANLAFLGALVVGAALASITRPDAAALGWSFGLGNWFTVVTLLVGGVMIGFGTTIAGGCTSGHGLCGTARANPASLVATGIFFGTSIVVSLVLQGVLS